MKYTGNYNLKKPEGSDVVNIEDFNDNADIIDQALKAHDDALATKETPQGAQAKANAAENAAKQYADQRVNALAGEGNTKTVKQIDDELASHKADYANLVDRVNNLNTNDIQARREILDIKLKLDEQQVIEFLNKTGIGFYDLFEDSGNIDMTNTTAAVDTTSADVIFNGQKTLKMKPQVFDDFNALELALYYKGEQKTLKVENNVFNSTQIDVMISSGSIAVGEKYYYNGEVYEVTGVSEA